MIKACLNGARAPGEHRALPLTATQLAADGAAAVAAGAQALHIHPRDATGARRSPSTTRCVPCRRHVPECRWASRRARGSSPR